MEISASAMTPENADTIFLTAIDKVICEVLKLDIDLVEKKQCLSDNKIFPWFHLISVESISFKYSFWRSAQFVQHFIETLCLYAATFSSKFILYWLGLFNFGRNNASSKPVAICYFSQPIYCLRNFLIEQYQATTRRGWPKRKAPPIGFDAF